jgi:hypothetical protein
MFLKINSGLLSLLLLILFLTSAANSQIKDGKGIFSINAGGTMAYNNNVSSELYYSNRFSLKSLNFEISYKFNEYNEAGFSIGKDYIVKRLTGKSFKIGGYSYEYDFPSEESHWIGLFYKFHYKDYFNAGVRLAIVLSERLRDDVMHEFSLGKDFSVTENIFLRMNVRLLTKTDSLFEFDNGTDFALGANAGIGIVF